MAGDQYTILAAAVDGVYPPSSVYRDGSQLRELKPAYDGGPMGDLSVRESSSHSSYGLSTTYSDLKVMNVMNGDDTTASAPLYSANACACCRSQKRRCDKKFPSCSRCTRMKTNCTYHWEQWGPHFNPQLSLADFLLFHIPVTGDHMWLPGTLESLEPYQQNIQARALNIDRFFGGLVMTTMVEHSQSLAGALDSYFGNIHPWLPIIHEQTFRTRTFHLGTSPEAEVALIFLVMLLLLETQRQDIGKESQLYNLSRYLFSFLQMSRSPSLELVQAGLLLAVYELGSGRSQAASLTIGTCARVGYVLRLNVDDPRLPEGHMSWVRSEEQRRVWLGVYMVDRLIHQVECTPSTPHAVEEPPLTYRLPIDDREWDRSPESPSRGFFQPSFSTPIHIPLCYFAREIQAVRILGQVQMLSRIEDPELLRQQMDGLDGALMQFMHRLFEQTPGSWEVLCGANATALMSALLLHKTRLTVETQTQPNSPDSYTIPPSPATDRSIFALCSIINMVRDICAKFSALDSHKKLRCVPLPSLICTGETARVAIWLNRTLPGSSIDVEPFRVVIAYAARSWGVAGDYLRHFG
ncbi:fungal-specific transcription factor domain-containing protein [Aspergillus keveii]|uniref:Fungal-specific transcription factor domain-containing protein n=1 Tax=Aspergillus keveii TaxID=714993 RepID=A0ABR4FQ64_9EURO